MTAGLEDWVRIVRVMQASRCPSLVNVKGMGGMGRVLQFLSLSEIVIKTLYLNKPATPKSLVPIIKWWKEGYIFWFLSFENGSFENVSFENGRIFQFPSLDRL